MFLLLGGPGSGKSALGAALQQRFPGLCHCSSGDLARMATGEDARRSPLLNRIGKQLGDSRQRKNGLKRLNDFVQKVLVEFLRDCAWVRCLLVDGLRASDLPAFEKAQAAPITGVLLINCDRETMLARVAGRGARDGDARLGLRDGAGDEVRVDAFLERASEEVFALKGHFGSLFDSTVRPVDGNRSLDECVSTAESALLEISQVHRAGAVETLKASDGCRGSGQGSVDWAVWIAATASRLDRELHPDGKPRVQPGG